MKLYQNFSDLKRLSFHPDISIFLDSNYFIVKNKNILRDDLFVQCASGRYLLIGNSGYSSFKSFYKRVFFVFRKELPLERDEGFALQKVFNILINQYHKNNQNKKRRNF